MAKEDNLRPRPFNSETAREAQKKSVEKRKENFEMAKVLREQLIKGSRGKKGMSNLADQVSHGGLQAIKVAADILAQDKTPTVEVEVKGLQFVVSSDEFNDITQE